MKTVINIKIQQCQDFRSFLLNTNDKYLIENTRNTFWGCGVNNDGRNMFGKMVMRLRDTFKTPSGQILTDADFPARIPTKPTNTPSNWGRKPLHMPMPSQHPQSQQLSQYTSSSYSRPSPRNIAPLDQTPQGDGAQFHHAPQHDGAQFHHATKRDGAPIHDLHHAPQRDGAQFHHVPQRDVAQFHHTPNVMLLHYMIYIMPLNVMVLNSIMPPNVMLLHYMIYIMPLKVMVLNSIMPLNVMMLNSIMPPQRDVAPLHDLHHAPQRDGAQFHHAPQRDVAQFHHAPKRDGAQFHHAPQHDVAQFHHAPQRDVAPLHYLHQAPPPNGANYGHPWQLFHHHQQAMLTKKWAKFHHPRLIMPQSQTPPNFWYTPRSMPQ